MNLKKWVTQIQKAGDILFKVICVAVCIGVGVTGVGAMIDSQKYSDYYTSLERGDCLMISTKIYADAMEKPLKVTFLHETDRVMFFEADGEINSILRNSDYNRIVRCSDIGSQGALL